ncbi:helix-turn-helix transcriptional regulator [Frankia sp. AgB1.9]|uniref:helix-turn-helix domain-containing protein n=1 Tax=unclassified Frankia TaxID=2632575 RepID=UPI00193150DB|nr:MULTISPECIES: helix-turn-helix transcriptional regulator [unclassified Frankia]MBL7490090.1 helix-turn-helix transcriptional regulator [Frankia sp. AgW1.1]MBL7551462.1 helix-turn-helix transcriptional regulator [Frankia sp. AgB1.9]MBL7624774.1 helix-turn-helix transcriptional regulator [Frankia sp. AgB1.8]
MTLPAPSLPAPLMSAPPLPAPRLPATHPVATVRRPTAAQLRAQAAALRVLGWTYRRIAVHWQRAYRLNARLAFRLAHGWTQDQAARQWNARWPADPKNDKAFSYWESWPARGGRAPSPDTLRRLAELYLCRPGDLLDGFDYSAFDPVAGGSAELTGRGGMARDGRGPGGAAGAAGACRGPVPGCASDPDFKLDPDFRLDPDFELDLGLGFGQEFWHQDDEAGRLACSGASRPASQYSRRSL